MKGVEEVTAYRTKDGKLFASAGRAKIHAVCLAVTLKAEKEELDLMVKNQCRCKRAMEHLRGKEAAAMQSEIDRRAARITKAMDFIKKGGV